MMIKVISLKYIGDQPKYYAFHSFALMLLIFLARNGIQFQWYAVTVLFSGAWMANRLGWKGKSLETFFQQPPLLYSKY